MRGVHRTGARPAGATAGKAAARTAETRAGPAALSKLAVAGEKCANSFTADTPVLMADGTHKPIAEIAVGDQVHATDPVSGLSADEPVLTLIRHSGVHRIVTITLADGSLIHATDNHPIWDTEHGVARLGTGG